MKNTALPKSTNLHENLKSKMFKIHLKNDSKPVINDYVLILNVPVQDASGVEEVHSRHHLPEMLIHNPTFRDIALIINRN